MIETHVSDMINIFPPPSLQELRNFTRAVQVNYFALRTEQHRNLLLHLKVITSRESSMESVCYTEERQDSRTADGRKDRGKEREKCFMQRNIQCQDNIKYKHKILVHHKSHMDRPGNEPQPA